MTPAKFTLPRPGTCRVCGCTDERACEGGCSWIKGEKKQFDFTLCSACAGSGNDLLYSMRWIMKVLRTGPFYIRLACTIGTAAVQRFRAKEAG